jgi:hypothetical protein
MTTMGFSQQGLARAQDFRASVVLGSQRYKELDRRQSYYDCTQHDYKMWDFDGRIIQTAGPGALAAQPMLSSERYSQYVPLRSRRPSSPYRLGRIIVNAFTNLIFGQQRFPGIRVEGDDDSQDWFSSVVKAGKLPVKMIQARNLGGATGSVGLSWCFDRRGKPRFEVHNAKHLFVHSWEDREDFIPEHVTETYVYPKTEWDGRAGKYVLNQYWYRRDWTPDGDLVFDDQIYRPGVDPVWSAPNEKLSTFHDHGQCHLAWIQNLPNDDIDGVPDYDGLYESFDTLDLLLSIISRGAVLNLDPTLVLKVDPEILALGVKKGSDNALTLGESGDAHYLELMGSSLDAGLRLFDSKRRSCLETAQCIVPDPANVAANGISMVSQRLLYAPMLGKGDILREQYGTPMERTLEQMHDYASTRVGAVVQVPTAVAGETEPKQLALNLPPRIVRTPELDPETKAPKLDDQGKPVETITQEDRVPGEGGDVELSWPAYFPSTPDDQQKALTTFSAAAGGKPILSQQTAVEMTAGVLGMEPTEEWNRVQKMGAADQQAEVAKAGAFGTGGDFVGGKVGSENELPEGAKPAAPKPPAEEETPPTEE